MIMDPSFLIELLRGSNLKVKEKAEELDRKFVTKGISSLTVMELWRGAVSSLKQEEEKKKVNDLLQSLIVFPFNEKEARKSAVIESELIKKGRIIDLEDIMIAGTALSNNETILTCNLKHFKVIDGLNVEDF
tara:strand:+ start:579 stop:974 length:396 start_codon:yes stop_codon:yes gene_type:complete